MPNEVAEKAIELVMEYEKKQGREPCRLSHGCDILSSGRKIEVKGLSNISHFELLNQYNIEILNSEKDFYLYVVFNIDTKPKLLILTRDEVLSNIRIVKQGVLPLRKVDYEKGIDL